MWKNLSPTMSKHGWYRSSAIIASGFLSALFWLVVDFFFGLVDERPMRMYRTKNFVKSSLSTPPQLRKISVRSALRLLRILFILFLSKKTWGAWFAKDSQRAGRDFSKYSLNFSVLWKPFEIRILSDFSTRTLLLRTEDSRSWTFFSCRACLKKKS